MTRHDEHLQKEREYWTSKVAEYRHKLRHAESKRDDAIVAQAPFKVGQEVEVNKRGAWVPAIVRIIDPNTFGCYYRVSFIKKNGDWADAVYRVFSEHEIRQSPTPEDSQKDAVRA